VEALTALGTLRSRRGLWREAIEPLRRAVAEEPDRVPAWRQLGEALNHLDDLSGALAAFERAAALEPQNARTLNGLGRVLDRLGRPEDATQMYRRAREVPRR
jgi:Flp pilus assembly protein TadD